MDSIQSDDGYIKLHRKLLGSRAFKNDGLCKTWIWCLLKASYTEKWVSVNTGKGTTEVFLRPGQFIFGRFQAAKELNVSPSTIRNRMEKLKNIGNVDIQQDTHWSVISIINWDTYQAYSNTDGQAKGHPEDRQRTGKGHIQEGKEGKEDISTLTGTCPQEQIIATYHAILPELPHVNIWNDSQRAQLRSRWREDKARQSIEWWSDYFGFVRESPFLMGNSKTDFQADLEWLVRKTNFAKIANGRYHRDGNGKPRAYSEKTRRTLENAQAWMDETEANSEKPKDVH